MDAIKDDLIKVKVSAPGKVILHGEHSVVYHKLAVACSVGLRTKLYLTELLDSQTHRLNLKDLDVNVNLNISDLKSNVFDQNEIFDVHTNFAIPEMHPINNYLKKIEKFIASDESLRSIPLSAQNAVIAFIYLYGCLIHRSGIETSALYIEIKSEIPVASGMGSSASFNVCLAAGLFEYIKRKIHQSPNNSCKNHSSILLQSLEQNAFTNSELGIINDWAFHCESIMHGNPSGIDNTICTFGSFVQYRKGSVPKPLKIQFRINALLINTKVPKHTKTMVNKVSEFKNNMEDIVQCVLETMETVSQRAVRTLAQLNTVSVDEDQYCKYFSELNKLIDINQNLLRILGVSHERIEHVCHILQKHQLHGKITGAGGGGYVVCLVPNFRSAQEQEEVKNELNLNGYEVINIELGSTGVEVV